ncbi:PAS domain S-box-containing protein [Natronocella acetinitrilica]|uniref:PAS domain S-box-containing protein n=1 Tax=Natronocella acetinitrilica TaxID=414046 RepID=A0AAE3KDV4_9GAMM|nr:PAS domain-containing protein [Natronocella acetinitrilica]MCP1676758.1 PAS domain S-box-containing protein [Natronocella acetinitrilica]
MTSSDLVEEARLRLVAEGKLRSGNAPPAAGWAVSADALGMLYRLASSPDTAHDALKLLHELQVHQVELGLQQGQLEAAERETTEAMNRYQALYELAPLGYFVVDRSGAILDVNRAGVSLLGVSRECLIGRAFGGYLAPESRPAMRDLFTVLCGEGYGATCPVRFMQGDVRANLVASVAPGGELVLMIASEEPGSRAS